LSSQNILLAIFLSTLAYLFYLSSDFVTISTGIALFIIGMHFLEDGFKRFTGGKLEEVLANSTNSMPKAIFTGFLSTSVVQSSSLVSIIVISFLSAGLIGLAGAIGIVFGSNLGTTTTAWIVAYFGVKVKISIFAMPMIIFGVILRFTKLIGIGHILLGLGLIFLGIDYMKDGFDTLKNSIDLAQFAMAGVLGLLVYILVGIIATVVIQSSSATMAIIITALASSQISYENALALAIGANIGTTITAVLASLTSNSEGKRLALAHLVFNLVTGFIAIIFIKQLSMAVNSIADVFAIEDMVLKLAIFHTLFNLIGILVMSGFIPKLVTFLESKFVEKEDYDKPIYLNDASLNSVPASFEVIQKEIEHLYDNSLDIIASTLSIEKCNLITAGFSESDLERVNKDYNIDEAYNDKIKHLYGEILGFIAKTQDISTLSDSENIKLNRLRVAMQYIVETNKDLKHLKKNLDKYSTSKNQILKTEYIKLKNIIAKTVSTINYIKSLEDTIDILVEIDKLRVEIKKMDTHSNNDIDKLIRNKELDTLTATSLMNDSKYTHSIMKKLTHVLYILWLDDTTKDIALKIDNEYLGSY
jgi:phosphate:Na+ symporter